jgi:hypothetical protein
VGGVDEFIMKQYKISTMENNSKAKLSHLYNYGCRFLEKMAWLEGESDDDNEEDEERYVDLDNNCS